MPYLPTSQKDKDELDDKDQAAPGTLGSGESSVINAGVQGAPVQKEKGPSKSGAFTNLQSYLSANQEQGGKLAEGIVQRVDEKAGQARAGLQQAQSTFQQKLNEGSTTNNQSLIDELKEDPTKVASDQAKYEQFLKQRDAEFKGPTGLQDVDGYNDIQSQFNRVNTEVERTKSEEGRFGLVQDVYGKPTYVKGQQRLDQLLLQNDPTARDKFSSTQSRYQGILDEIGSATEGSRAAAQAREAETLSARELARNTVSQEDQALQARIAQQVEEANKRRTEQYGAIQEDVADDLLTQETLEALGLSAGQSLYDLNLNDPRYLSQGQEANKYNAASDEDYARYLALSKLAGMDPTFLTEEMRPQAGSVGAPVEFNENLFLQDIAAKKAAFEGQAAPIQKSIKDAQDNYNHYNRLYAEAQTRDDVSQSSIDYFKRKMKEAQTSMANHQGRYQELVNVLKPNRKLGLQ